jgi:hypothetical protein
MLCCVNGFLVFAVVVESVIILCFLARWDVDVICTACSFPMMNAKKIVN